MNRKRWERMKRAAYRSEQNRKDLVWKKLSGNNDGILTGYRGTTEWDALSFYCPYMPIMRDGSVGIIMAGTTA